MKVMSEDYRCSPLNSAAAWHSRTQSEPGSAGLGSSGASVPPSPTPSLAQVSHGPQSSQLLQPTYYPRSSPTVSTPVFCTGYEVPYGARETQSAAETHMREYSAVKSQAR